MKTFVIIESIAIQSNYHLLMIKRSIAHLLWVSGCPSVFQYGPLPLKFCIILFHLLSLSVEQKSPLFLTASFVISNHLLFISLYLSETSDNFSLSQRSLLIILYLYIHIYFSLFDKKLSFCHHFPLDLLRLLLPLSLFLPLLFTTSSDSIPLCISIPS